MTEQDQMMETIMGLIVNGGNAKSDAMEAIQAAKKGNFEVAADKLKASDQSLVAAHHSQTSLLTQEASGEAVRVSLLMVHAQDHLMNAITFRDLAGEVVEVYHRLSL